MGIGNNLKKILDKKGMSVSELAKQSKIPPTTLYSLIKRDSNDEKASILTKIAKPLGIDSSDLLALSDFDNLDGEKVYLLCKKIGMKPSEFGFVINDPKLIKSGENSDEIMETLFGEGSSYLAAKMEADNYTLLEDNLLKYYSRLNRPGQEKAVAYAEDLTKVPEYQRTPDQEEDSDTAKQEF